MLQKLIVGFLMLTVIGAAGVGIYDANRSSSAAETNPLLANDNPAAAQIEPVVLQNESNATPTVEPATVDTTTPSQQPVQQQLQKATDMVGDPWMAQGTILSFDTAGMTLAINDNVQVYVELGPPHYWQAQDVTLAVGEVVNVNGFYNGDQYHAATVTKMDGSQLVVRTAEGLPLWSGSANNDQTSTNGQNGNAGQQNANGQNANTTGLGQTQVAPEDWITLDATVISQNTSGLTVQTQAGETLTLQLGQARFVDGQAVTFAAGDEIQIRGFWQDTTFRAGEIVKLATGERLMLLDPNGRPLWGGPGRSGSANGQAGGNGQGGNGQGNNNQDTTGQGSYSQGNGQGGNGQGGNGQGNGKGYRGGRQ